MSDPNAFRPDLKILNLNIKTGSEFTSLDDSEDIFKFKRDVFFVDSV